MTGACTRAIWCSSLVSRGLAHELSDEVSSAAVDYEHALEEVAMRLEHAPAEVRRSATLLFTAVSAAPPANRLLTHLLP